MGHLLRIGLVKRLAKFAAVNLRVLPDPGRHFLWIVVPALEMPGAKFSLGILLIAGALPGFAHLDFLFRRHSLGRGRSGRGSRSRRCCGRRRGRCCRRSALRCYLFGHSSVPFSGLDARSVLIPCLSFVSYSNPSRETKRHFSSAGFSLRVLNLVRFRKRLD